MKRASPGREDLWCQTKKTPGFYRRSSLICGSKRTNQKQAGKGLLLILRCQFVFLSAKQQGVASTRKVQRSHKICQCVAPNVYFQMISNSDKQV